MPFTTPRAKPLNQSNSHTPIKYTSQVIAGLRENRGKYGTVAVSYTHLDVYKRQHIWLNSLQFTIWLYILFFHKGAQNKMYMNLIYSTDPGLNIVCLLYTSRCV